MYRANLSSPCLPKAMTVGALALVLGASTRGRAEEPPSGSPRRPEQPTQAMPSADRPDDRTRAGEPSAQAGATPSGRFEFGSYGRVNVASDLRGRTGRAFRAVRDSETAAVSSGVSLARTKALAFGISAAYAGAAGALFAIATTYVNPDTFPVALSIFLLVGVVIAGLGSLQGLIIGAIFIQFMPLWAQNISKSPGAPAVIYGAFLILVVLALPGGAAGLFARLLQLTRRGRDFPKP